MLGSWNTGVPANLWLLVVYYLIESYVMQVLTYNVRIKDQIFGGMI